jgi:hypothetical protein
MIFLEAPLAFLMSAASLIPARLIAWECSLCPTAPEPGSGTVGRATRIEIVQHPSRPVGPNVPLPGVLTISLTVDPPTDFFVMVPVSADQSTA